MNNELTWQLIQEQGPVILYPQLNPAPKAPVFSRIRRELFDHNQSGIYLTCNWAEGTVVYAPPLEQEKIRSRESWSCIYHKHTDDMEQKWTGKRELR